MKTESVLYQNVYKNKSGKIWVAINAHVTIEDAKKAALNQKKDDKYIGTIPIKPFNIL